MDDAVTGGSAMVDGDLGYDNLARKPAEEDIQHAVIAAYTNALQGPEDMRRRAFIECVIPAFPKPSPAAESRLTLASSGIL
jgi:hypothetical protein